MLPIARDADNFRDRSFSYQTSATALLPPAHPVPLADFRRWRQRKTRRAAGFSGYILLIPEVSAGFLLVNHVQGARQVNILGMQLAPDHERACLVGFKADRLGFTRLEDFLDSICVNREALADGRFVLDRDLYALAFFNDDIVGLIQNIEGANILDCYTFDLKLRSVCIVSVDDDIKFVFRCLRSPYQQQPTSNTSKRLGYFHHYLPYLS